MRHRGRDRARRRHGSGRRVGGTIEDTDDLGVNTPAGRSFVLDFRCEIYPRVIVGSRDRRPEAIVPEEEERNEESSSGERGTHARTHADWLLLRRVR